MQIYPITLVPKTDMESGADNGTGYQWIPTGWSVTGGKVLLTQVDSTSAFGVHSLHFENDPDNLGTNGIQFEFPVVAGRTYQLKFWAKWTGEEAGTMKYLVKNGNGTTNMNGQVYTISTASFVNWKMVTRDFLCTIAGSLGRVRFRPNAVPTIWFIDQVSLIELTSDSYYTPDPTEQLSVASDFFKSSRGGDVWHHSIDESRQDIAWDILNENLQSIAWDILNESSQDIAWDVLNATAQYIAWHILHDANVDFSWSVFARVLYFIQQFFVKAICFEYNIKEPITFKKQIVEPQVWSFYPTSVIEDISYLQGGVFNTVNIVSPQTFNFQIQEPIQFTFQVATVLQGEQVEYPPA
jgi:hypothetical protein